MHGAGHVTALLYVIMKETLWDRSIRRSVIHITPSRQITCTQRQRPLIVSTVLYFLHSIKYLSQAVARNYQLWLSFLPVALGKKVTFVASCSERIFFPHFAASLVLMLKF